MAKKEGSSPATLTAIAVAARRSGDRDLETFAKRELADRFGITLRFSRDAATRIQRELVPVDSSQRSEGGNQ